MKDTRFLPGVNVEHKVIFSEKIIGSFLHIEISMLLF